MHRSNRHDMMPWPGESIVYTVQVFEFTRLDEDTIDPILQAWPLDNDFSIDTYSDTLYISIKDNSNDLSELTTYLMIAYNTKNIGLVHYKPMMVNGTLLRWIRVNEDGV